MKKICTMLVTMAILVSGVFCGCNSTASQPSSGTTAANSSSDAPAADNTSSTGMKIGFTISERDQFLSSLETAMINVAKEKGVELTVFDSQRDVQKQLDHVTTFASQGFDAIIVNLVDASNTEGVVREAGDIPVIFVNRLPDEKYLVEGQTAYVGSDEMQSGGLQAEFLADYFKDKNPKTLNYVLFMGTLGLPHTNLRTQSVKEGLESAGFTLNQMFEDTAEYERAKSMEKMQQFLGTGKEFDVVICNNDEMALGVIEALRAVGKTDIPVVGIDATGNALDAIEKGELACSVFQNPVGQGTGALEVAFAAASGEAFEAENWIPFELVTKDNVADYKN